MATPVPPQVIAPETPPNPPYIASAEIEGMTIDRDGAAIVFNRQLISCEKSGRLSVMDGQYVVLGDERRAIYNCSVVPCNSYNLDSCKSIPDILVLNIKGYGNTLMFYGGLIYSVAQFEKYKEGFVINNRGVYRRAHLFSKRFGGYCVIDSTGKIYGVAHSAMSGFQGKLVETNKGLEFQDAPKIDYLLMLTVASIIAPLWYMIYKTI